MRILSLPAITVMAIAFLLALSAYIIFNPVLHPRTADIVWYVRPNQTTAQVSTIVIPDGSDNSMSGKNLEPQHLVVMLGVNSTVRWLNEQNTTVGMGADNRDDMDFFDATNKQTYLNTPAVPSKLPNFMGPGKSFEYTFTKPGYFEYRIIEPHPRLVGYVLVLPNSTQNVVKTVTLDDSSGIPNPCGVFAIPCPLNPNHTFSAQKLGLNIYIEKFTGNGVVYYAIIHNSKICTFSTNYGGTCTNPDDLAILRFIGVNTSVPQKIVDVSVTGLKTRYLVGEPIDFDIQIQGYGPCDFPSVSVMQGSSVVWKGVSGAVSCPSPMVRLDETWRLNSLDGPIILNQTGTYAVLVRYDSNMTQQNFDVVLQKGGV